MKYYIWGLGAVGFSFLKLVKDNAIFNPEDFFCIEQSEEKKQLFLEIGGLESHFIIDKITKDNYLDYLAKLSDGDYLFDFAINIKNLEILKYCLEHNIHYLNTADSSWKNDKEWRSDHQHFLEYVKIKEQYKQHKTTSICLFGMNPGLVSSFTKKCIQEIVDKDSSLFVRIHRKKLKKLISNNEYGKVCKILKVRDIQEVDNDDQVINIPYDENVCYSTWNVWAYYYETVSFPEIAFGNKKRYLQYNKIYDCDQDDLYLGLRESAYKYEDSSYSPQGYVLGHLSTHEEIFTIRKYLTYKRYKPTVHFLYSPCEYALMSVKRFARTIPTNLHLIKKEEISSGGESVGIIIQGKRFKTRYYGNYLNNSDIDDVVTVFQVGVSAYAAFEYIRNHPNQGMLFPEELDEKEVLFIAGKYLKNFISVEIPRIKMNLGK